MQLARIPGPGIYYFGTPTKFKTRRNGNMNAYLK
jgi:hypothetical protein